jgi:hypothetical protein
MKGGKKWEKRKKSQSSLASRRSASIDLGGGTIAAATNNLFDKPPLGNL